MTQTVVQTINELVDYDKFTGRFYTKTQKHKELHANEDLYIVLFHKHKRWKVKANKLAYELGTQTKIPDDYVVLHRNLDKQDFRLCNLMIVPSTTMQQITEAHRNLSSDLKITPHPKDIFAYVVSWIEHRQQKRKVVHDVVAAKQLYTKLQLRYAKVLGKYLVLD